MPRCAVVGCNNTNKTHKMFWLPHAMKEPEARKIWIKNVNRKDWVPGDSSYICSKHFVDGRPTEINPYPTKEMDSNCPAKKGRKLGSESSQKSQFHVFSKEVENLDSSYTSNSSGGEEKDKNATFIVGKVKNKNANLTRKTNWTKDYLYYGTKKRTYGKRTLSIPNNVKLQIDNILNSANFAAPPTEKKSPARQTIGIKNEKAEKCVVEKEKPEKCSAEISRHFYRKKHETCRICQRVRCIYDHSKKVPFKHSSQYRKKICDIDVKKFQLTSPKRWSPKKLNSDEYVYYTKPRIYSRRNFDDERKNKNRKNYLTTPAKSSDKKDDNNSYVSTNPIEIKQEPLDYFEESSNLETEQATSSYWNDMFKNLNIKLEMDDVDAKLPLATIKSELNDSKFENSTFGVAAAISCYPEENFEIKVFSTSDKVDYEAIFSTVLTKAAKKITGNEWYVKKLKRKRALKVERTKKIRSILPSVIPIISKRINAIKTTVIREKLRLPRLIRVVSVCSQAVKPEIIRIPPSRPEHTYSYGIVNKNRVEIETDSSTAEKPAVVERPLRHPVNSFCENNSSFSIPVRSFKVWRFPLNVSTPLVKIKDSPLERQTSPHDADRNLAPKCPQEEKFVAVQPQGVEPIDGGTFINKNIDDVDDNVQTVSNNSSDLTVQRVSSAIHLLRTPKNTVIVWNGVTDACLATDSCSDNSPASTNPCETDNKLPDVNDLPPPAKRKPGRPRKLAQSEIKPKRGRPPKKGTCASVNFDDSSQSIVKNEVVDEPEPFLSSIEPAPELSNKISSQLKDSSRKKKIRRPRKSFDINVSEKDGESIAKAIESLHNLLG